MVLFPPKAVKHTVIRLQTVNVLRTLSAPQQMAKVLSFSILFKNYNCSEFPFVSHSDQRRQTSENRRAVDSHKHLNDVCIAVFSCFCLVFFFLSSKSLQHCSSTHYHLLTLYRLRPPERAEVSFWSNTSLLCLFGPSTFTIFSQEDGTSHHAFCFLTHHQEDCKRRLSWRRPRELQPGLP